MIIVFKCFLLWDTFLSFHTCTISARKLASFSSQGFFRFASSFLWSSSTVTAAASFICLVPMPKKKRTKNWELPNSHNSGLCSWPLRLWSSSALPLCSGLAATADLQWSKAGSIQHTLIPRPRCNTVPEQALKYGSLGCDLLHTHTELSDFTLSLPMNDIWLSFHSQGASYRKNCMPFGILQW